MLWFIFIALLIVQGLAFIIDRKRKKHNNDPLKKTDPDSKQGEESNYKMGDDDYFGGGF